MNRIRRTAILTAAALAMAGAPLAGASADEYYYRTWRPHHHRDNDVGGAVAAGVLGLAAGAIIGSALAPAPGPDYAPPPPAYIPAPGYSSQYYYPPAPVSSRTTIVVGRDDGGDLAPWSPEWNRYCANRYPSFDPRTGTFLGYDGHEHFCVGP